MDGFQTMLQDEKELSSRNAVFVVQPFLGAYNVICQLVHAATGELKTGYLEKRVGEHSGRQNVPLGDAFKWQKRYFVLTEPKGMLYYFKSADDPPNYRGVINLR